MSYTESKITEEIRKLNEQFWAGLTDPPGITIALDTLGIDTKKSVLISIIPDSGSTFIVHLKAADERILEIDLDMSDVSSAEIETIDSANYRKRQGQIKMSVIEKLFAERSNAV